MAEQCSWAKAVKEGGPDCVLRRWLFFGGLAFLASTLVCCVVALNWLVYRRAVREAKRNKADAESPEAESPQALAPGRNAVAQEELQEEWDPEPRDEEWDPEPPDEADAIPQLLIVTSPNKHTSCAGEYELVLDLRPNGQPLWKKRDGCRWIYSGVDGRWYIGGSKSENKNFACASGYIFCSQPHRSMSPDEMAIWEWGQGTTWHKDGSISVTSLSQNPPTKLASVGTYEKGVEDHSPRITVGRGAHLTPATLKTSVELWSAPLKEALHNDGPGLYLVHDHTAVTHSVELTGDPFAFLSAGACVHVAEVSNRSAENRVRGRIEQPKGWISLVNSKDGYRFAERIADQDTLTEATTAPSSAWQASSEISTEPGSFRAQDKCCTPVASAPCTRTLSSLGLRGRKVDPPESRPLPQKEPAVALRIHSPNGMHGCIGLYEIVPNERPNGQPLWRHQDGNHWLYQGTNGRWCVAGSDVRDEGFSRSAGFISQTEVHRRGEMPYECETPWQRWEWAKTSFTVDTAITVKVTSLSSASSSFSISPSSDSGSGSVGGSSSCRLTSLTEEAIAACSRGSAVGMTGKPLSGDHKSGSSNTAEPVGNVSAETIMLSKNATTPLRQQQYLEALDANSGSNSSEVTLECVHAATADISCKSHWQRCITKTVVRGSSWRIGPRLQPQMFAGMATKALPNDVLFELLWRPPCIYLVRPTPLVRLVLDEVPVERAQTPLRHGSELGICTLGASAPVLTFRVLHSAADGQALPQVVQIVTPHKQTTCSGAYDLLEGQMANGLPIWQKRAGSSRWLYLGRDGRWYVGGNSAKEKQFKCSTGFLYHDKVHAGKLPHELPGPWAWGGHEDPGILVGTPRSVGVAADVAKAAEAAGVVPAEEGGPSVMDLRGCGLSAERRSVVQASRSETLRIIV